jgi:sugar O-acyltransferase (sialic acid O-acetyltransferase NeuD family)
MTLWIIGGGGQARAAAETASACGIALAGLVIPEGERADWFEGARLDEAAFLARTGADAIHVAIGDNHTRSLVSERLGGTSKTVHITSLIHPAATVATSAKIGAGTLVLAGCVVNAFARIGQGVTLYSGVVVEHDCTLGDYASLAPRAALGGGVAIGAGTHIGVGASVSHRVSIGANSVIGTGAAVVGDLPAGIIAYGVPARVMRTRALGESCL